MVIPHSTDSPAGRTLVFCFTAVRMRSARESEKGSAFLMAESFTDKELPYFPYSSASSSSRNLVGAYGKGLTAVLVHLCPSAFCFTSKE